MSLKHHTRFAVAVLSFAVTPGLSADAVKDVNVVNTPTVQAQQAGDWAVSIDASREPFQHELRFTTPDGFSEFTDQFTVPAGKRLVLEQVSAVAAPPVGQIVRYFSLRTTANGVFAFHTVPAAFNGFVDFTGCQQVRLYADAGTDVKLSSPRSAGTGSFLTVATVSGYLIPMP